MTLEEKIQKLINPKNSLDPMDFGKLTIHPTVDVAYKKIHYHVIFNPSLHEDPKHPRFVAFWASTIEEGVERLLKDCENIVWK